MENKRYDYVIIGSGIGGLFTGALLAGSGKKVCILESHSEVGGYGHSFRRKGYIFCAELHYIFNCMEGEPGHRFFRQLGLDKEIGFLRLDEKGYDKLRFPGISYDIAKGEENIRRLVELFPEYEKNIHRYFKIVNRLCDGLYDLPLGFTRRHLMLHPFRYRTLLKYRRYTLERFFEELEFPEILRSVLAGQFPDIMVPPNKASLLIHAGNSMSYDRGACVPRKGFHHLFGSVRNIIEKSKDSCIRTNSKVVKMNHHGKKITDVITKKGEIISGDRFIFNSDPRSLTALMDKHVLSERFLKKLDYKYSASSFTIYLGLKEISLKRYGFGNNNIIHYPYDDINTCFERQHIRCSMDNPWLFMTSPTQHIEGIAPDGSEQLIIVTSADYDHFRKFKNKEDYIKEKNRIAGRILDIIEEKYIPDLRSKIDVMVVGSPLTNERFVNTVYGNSYGMELSPENINEDKVMYNSTGLENLYLIGAIAGIPSFGGGLHTAMQLFSILEDKNI